MKKFSSRHIGYSFVYSLFSAFVAVLIFGDTLLGGESASASLGTRLLILAGMYLAVYLAMSLYSIAYVHTSGYELTQEDIRCRRGVLFRKSSVLSYQKIHAVNKKQNLIQRLFGIATLTVDSGATGNAFGAEITVIESAEEVDRLIDRIKRRQEGLEDPVPGDIPVEIPKRENLYRFTSRLKLVYSGLNVAASLVVLLILAAAAVVVAAIASAVLHSSPGFSPEELWLGLLFLTLLCMLLCAVISLIGGIVTSFFNYHDFRIHRSKEDIEISYGLFVRHTNTFKFSRIKGVKIMEGPVKRLFGFASAGLEVVGYGSASSSDNAEQNQAAAPGMLLPLCRKKDLPALLASILPGYVPEEPDHKARFYPAFVLWPWLKTAIGYALGALIILVSLLLAGVPGIVLSIVLGFLAVAALVHMGILAAVGAFRCRNAGLALGEDRLTVRTGALVRKTTVIQWKDIIGIERIATPLQAQRGICSYRIHFFTNAMTNTVEVSHLDAALGDLLEAKLRD